MQPATRSTDSPLLMLVGDRLYRIVATFDGAEFDGGTAEPYLVLHPVDDSAFTGRMLVAEPTGELHASYRIGGSLYTFDGFEPVTYEGRAIAADRLVLQ